jgi:excisionase family DNA binding protein
MTEMITIKDVMDVLLVGRTTAYRIAKRIGFTRVSRGAIRIDKDAFQAYLKTNHEQDSKHDQKLLEPWRRDNALREAKEHAAIALQKIEEATRL